MPTAMPCIAIWDTGAMGTVITPKVVADLGLKPSEQITVQGVGPAGTSQSHPASTYLINLFLQTTSHLRGYGLPRVPLQDAMFSLAWT